MLQLYLYLPNLLGAAEGGKGGGLLELLGIDFNILIIQLVGFLVLLWFMTRYFWKPINAMLEARRQDINATYDKIEADRRAMEQLRTEYEARLAQIEAEARERIQQAVGEAQQLRDQIVADARRQADDIVARAQEQAKLEGEKLRSELQTYVADLTLAATERLLREAMTDERHRRLVQEFIETAEVR
ncbi:F0F1 ATP synthase subunit B [Synechococcus sp. RC10A2]|jgi:F-type H+-transporting ATPase subunit b|uniref:F0F1 ATP synthase subunit B n=1 Tax=Synechococcus sp. RC10A2 TaxID=2964529 RepID=UPI0039C6BEB5